MNKETQITDEMVKTFINDAFFFPAKREVLDQWDKFLSSHQSPSDEWEVVELICNNGAISVFDAAHQGLYKSVDKWVSAFLNANIGWKIKKVCRRSDNANLEAGKEYEINGMNVIITTVDLKGITFIGVNERFESGGMGLHHIYSIKEHSPVLFTTVDGLQVCKGNQVRLFRVQDDFSLFESDAIAEIAPPESFKYFSTKEAAESYMKEHKPYLSLAMIRKALESCKKWHTSTIEIFMQYVEQGLSKLKTKDNA